MKTFALLLSSIVLATTSAANTRDWKTAMVINVSETDVSGGMRSNTNTVHYTVETQDMVYFANYAYNPGLHHNHAPEIAVNMPTKIAVEGKTAYLLDTTGAEVKLHIVKKNKK